MTKPSTKEFGAALKRLRVNKSHYYVKRRSIVEKITFEHRTFYAKFERIDEPLDSTVISQHLDLQYVIAVPLLKNGKTNYLVIEYRGTKPLRFYHTGKHLMQTLQIEEYTFYQGKRENFVQLFMDVEAMSLEKADRMARNISDNLELRLPKEWKCFPDISLPESYNIITLPYGEYLR